MKKHILSIFSLCIGLLASAQSFNPIVATDGSGDYLTIQSAIDACPDNVRSIIFIKNGTYAEQVSLGSKLAASTKKISLIGESPTGVIITHSQSRASSGSPTFEDICTVKLYANDFYAENLTIQNTAGNTGMAEALYTAGDRQTFKNCRILGYQDTYRSKKGTRGYFKNCWIEGAVDFIYAGGVLFFDDCTINCVKGGGYITAPEDAISTISKTLTVSQKFLRVGFFFRNCSITANADVPDNSYYLGRPWNTSAGTFYLNCKLGKHIKAEGWKEWGGNETSSSFAEYKSVDINGLPVDTTRRVSWSFQLPKADVDNLLSPEAVYARVSSTVYDPFTLCNSPLAPFNIRIENAKIVWDVVANTAGYLVYKNNVFQAIVSDEAFTDPQGLADLGAYKLYSIATTGVLSEAGSSLTGISPIEVSDAKVSYKNSAFNFSEEVKFTLFTTAGEQLFSTNNYTNRYLVNSIYSGVYLLQLTDRQLKTKVYKVSIK